MNRLLSFSVGLVAVFFFSACGSQDSSNHTKNSDNPSTEKSDKPKLGERDASVRSFANWCKDENASSAAKLMIAQVLKTVRTNDCDEADLLASKRTSLQAVNTYLPLDLAPIESLSNLTELKVYGAASLINVDTLAGLENLVDLNVSSTDLTNLEDIAKISSLRVLDLGFNDIVDVSPLAKLDHLEDLDLQDNKIVDVTPLASLKKLYRLKLEGNPIPEPRKCPVVPDVCEF